MNIKDLEGGDGEGTRNKRLYYMIVHKSLLIICTLIIKNYETFYASAFQPSSQISLEFFFKEKNTCHKVVTTRICQIRVFSCYEWKATRQKAEEAGCDSSEGQLQPVVFFAPVIASSRQHWCRA